MSCLGGLTKYIEHGFNTVCESKVDVLVPEELPVLYRCIDQRMEGEEERRPPTCHSVMSLEAHGPIVTSAPNQNNGTESYPQGYNSVFMHWMSTGIVQARAVHEGGFADDDIEWDIDKAGMQQGRQRRRGSISS